MVKRKVAALEKVEADLVNLQYKIRRDPKSYAQEFYDQWLAYDAQRQIFISSPTTASSEDVTKFHDLVDLVAHVADLYPDITGPYPGHLKELLNQHHAVLNPELREKVVGSLVLIRRKDVIDSADLLTTLFPILVSTPSKSLRSLLYSKIISELRESNSKTTNHRLNRTIQTVLHNLVTSDRTSTKGQWATRITRELWRRQVWTDAKPCDVMKEACLSDNEKVVVGGVRFFLGGDKEREDADDSSDEEVDLKKVKHVGGINKKTKKRAKAYERAVDKVKRQEKKKSAPHALNFSALHLLHDPQGFAEQLFQKHLQNTKNRFSLDNKLLILQLVTRLVGLHQLTVITLYSWFARYLTPKQAQVTSFLASLAQATHSLVPPDALEPLVIKIANEFVSEGSASEVAAAGINAIREICVRQPLCITETLLQDLVLYQRSKDKGVVMAAKGLQSLYREQYPELLQKKYRGKEATMGLRSGEVKQRRFGEQEVGGIEGIELLEQYKEALKKKRFEEAMANGDDPDKKDEDDDGFNSDEWELGSSESDDDEDGWINVSDDEEEVIAKPPTKRQKKDAGDDAPDLVDAEKEKAATEAAAEATRISVLATTSILTPADLAKLQELRREANVDKALGTRSKRVQEMIDRHIDEGVTADDIELPAQLGKKTTREERVAMAKEGKPGRDEHKSTQAIRKSKKEAEGKSTTNKEKSRQKNFMMTVGKARQKNKRGLTETKKMLKEHISRSKKGGRRGNFNLR